MERINVAELLKDCPKGMELDCTMFDGVYFDHVDDLRLNRIKCYVNNGNEHFEIEFEETGQYISNDSAKCVIFPKGKTTWEGFQKPFEDGDILAYNSAVGTTIFIHRNKNGEHTYKTSFYVGLNGRDKLLVYDKYSLIALNGDCDTRLATEEEKEKLFQAIKDNGYKWNAETKTLEKLGEQKFKNGDVIVCENHWGPFISIFKENVTERNGFIGHCVFDVDDNKFKVKDSAMYFNKVRFATKREKELLFVAIERNGYQWNSEINTLEKLIEPRFDITTLVPFKSRVLIRNADGDLWKPAIYGFPYSKGCYVVGGVYWRQCIPYEANKELLGTTNNPEEYGSR